MVVCTIPVSPRHFKVFIACVLEVFKQFSCLSLLPRGRAAEESKKGRFFTVEAMEHKSFCFLGLAA